VKRVLVTGASGFVGPYLIKELLASNGEEAHNLEIYGTKRWRSSLLNAQRLGIADKIRWLDMHLEDAQSVNRAVKIANPDWVFHLAAQSFVPASFEAPLQTMATNADGTFHLLESLTHDGQPNVRVQICGTSEEYGLVEPEEVPIYEDNPLRPQSPYGIAKVTAENWGHFFRRAYGMHVVVTRAFNHEGAGRPPVFAPSDWCKQAVEVQKGTRDKIIHGNLDAIRDYLDVRDVVRGYILALTRGNPQHPYNICSGAGMTMAEVLNNICIAANLEGKYVLQSDPNRIRPAEVPRLIGNAERIKRETGWEPLVPFTHTILDMLDYWRHA
jgi:GDP-4-dehydro-6-deoxy-D-mannose reductase